MTDLACFINPVQVGQSVTVEFGTRQPMTVTAVTEARVCVRYPNLPGVRYPNLPGVRWYPLADVLRWNPELDRPAPAPKPERPMRELAAFMPEHAPLLPTRIATSARVHHDALKRGDVFTTGTERLRIVYIAKRHTPRRHYWQTGDKFSPSKQYVRGDSFRLALVENVRTGQKRQYTFRDSHLLMADVVSGPSLDAAKRTDALAPKPRAGWLNPREVA